jgi:2-polyprenyl-3-methyl-5-hydroxy-6-metoxy-1,4-benzoquinol methylase
MKNNREKRIQNIGYKYSSEEKKYIEKCNLCDSNIHTVITHVDRYGFPASASACNNCGLTILNPVMTPESYMNFYSDVYRPLVSAYHDRLINSETIQAEQVEYAYKLTKLIGPFAKEVKLTTLLDIGGSTGVVSRILREKFKLKATVLDPAADELACAEGSEMEVISGFIEDYNPDGREFDLIVFCQTIDHVLDALGSLKKIRELLSSNGLFFVDIVDFRAAYLRNNSIEEAIKIDHPYYFTEETMELMLTKAGFNIMRKSYADDHLHIGYICNKSINKKELDLDKESVSGYFHEIRKIQNYSEK